MTKKKPKIKDSVKKRFRITKNGKVFYRNRQGKKKEVKSKRLADKIRLLLGYK